MANVVGGAPAPAPISWARLEPNLAAVKLPDGRELQKVSPVELSKILLGMRVPGVEASMGYATMAQAYRDYLSTVADAAAAAAVEQWLQKERAP